MFEGGRQLLARLNPQLFQGLGSGNEIALSRNKPVPGGMPCLLCLGEAKSNFFNRFDKANEFIIKIPGLFGND